MPLMSEMAGHIFLIPDTNLGLTDDIRPERVSSAHNDWIQLSREILDKKVEAAGKGQWMPTSDISEDHKALHPFGAQFCPALQEMSNIGYILKWPQNAVLTRQGDRAWKIDTYGEEPFYKYHNMTSFPEAGIAEVLSIGLGWIVVTPPGWSCLIKNVPNNLDEYKLGISIAEGSLRTDRATVRLQVHAFIQPSSPDRIVIKRGRPMCLIMPFLRERLEMHILEAPEVLEIVHEQAFKDQNTFIQAPGKYRELFVESDENPSPLYPRLMKLAADPE